MNKEHRTTRIYAETLRLLKIVAAMRQTSMIEVMEELVKKEADRMGVK
jgi:hypothetical protein